MTVAFSIEEAIKARSAFSAVVNMKGKNNPRTGSFHTIDDAHAAGHQSIFVRNGQYPKVTMNGPSEVTIVGESWDVIVDGDGSDHAFDVEAASVGVWLSNFSVQTPSGGGSAHHGVRFNSAANSWNVAHRIQVIECDDTGFYLNGQQGVGIFHCKTVQTDLFAIWGNSSSHYMKVTGCDFAAASSGSTVATHGDWCSISGNIIRGTVETLSAAANCGVIGNVVDAETIGGSSHTFNNEVY